MQVQYEELDGDVPLRRYAQFDETAVERGHLSGRALAGEAFQRGEARIYVGIEAGSGRQLFHGAYHIPVSFLPSWFARRGSYVG